MSNIHQIDGQAQRKQQAIADDEQRLDDASAWVAKLDRGLNQQEKQTLQLWLAKAPENIAVLLEMAQLWDKMDELSRLSDLFPSSSRKKVKITAWYTSLAASVILAMLLGFYQTDFGSAIFSAHKPSAVVAMQTSYQTNVGESHTINLPDSSKIVLNTNSFVQITYTTHSRIIELQRGEIHIDVAHDTSRPLSVIAAGKVIQAVGTAFNVEVKNELVELIVTDGKVLVAKSENASMNSDIEEIAKKLPQNSMAISKGEKINLDSTGQYQEKIVKVDPLEIATSLSWRQGNLIFRGESLADAMAEIGRYTKIEFTLADDEKLKKVQVAGMFKTGDVTGLLEVLNRNFNISYERISEDKIRLKYAG